MQTAVTPIISVIVASHRETCIETFVRHWHATPGETIPVEILIVADYPVDRYRNKFPAIRWLFVLDTSISRKRNAGITAAQGEICAFIDDDCRPEEGWIAHAISYLEAHPDVAGVEGHTTVAPCETRAGAYKEFKRLEKRGFRTNNIFYRRRILTEGHYFDERFTVQREDVDLAFSLLEAGHAIGYSTDIRVEHCFRTNEPWDLLKNCVNRRFDPLLYHKHKSLYRQHIGSPYPPGIFALLCMVIGSAGLIPLYQPAVMHTLIIYAGMVSFLAFRRAGFTHPLSWLRECLSFVLAPFVLCGALIYGSIRFRYIFLL